MYRFDYQAPDSIEAALAALRENDGTKIVADDFFTDMFETALEDDEIITAVRFPIPKRAAYMKFPNPASRYAIVGVMVAEATEGIRVAVTGAAPCVFRVTAMEGEGALGQDFTSDAVASIALNGAEFNEDIHASAEYRAHLVNVMARRAVAAARVVANSIAAANIGTNRFIKRSRNRCFSYGSSSGFGGDELDLDQPFRLGQSLDDNARGSGPRITKELGAGLRHRPEVVLARHEGRYFDDIIHPHTGGFQNRHKISPGGFSLGLDSIGRRAVGQ